MANERAGNGFKAIVLARRLVALAVFAGFVALFAGFFVKKLGFLAKWQFVPSVLAGSMVIAVGIVVMTLVFGRLYCSICCPLGIFQDIAFMLMPHRAQGKKSRVQTIVRYACLTLFLALGFAGLGFSWIEPYGLFGRIATSLVFGLALGVVIFALAVWKGRVWCNWVCPVGTFLGGLSRRAPLALGIDSSRCIGCRKCENGCRASAITISGKGGTIDRTKCVDCYDCAAVCPKGAIGAGAGQAKAPQGTPETSQNPGITRRSFIIGSAATAAAIAADAADEKIFDGGFAEVSAPGIDARNASLKPAGSHSIRNFQTKCVGCQLCVKACPNHVLRPSMRLKDFMQPEMAFDKGYCTIDCHRCGHVCPAGAIEAIPSFMKKDIHIGEAVWHRDRCLAAAEGVNCTACFRHCPVNAIERVKGEDGILIPVVDADKCIGCGACEHVCPARPLPGMTVRAFERHREVWPTGDEAVLGEARRLLAGEFACILVKDGVIVAREKGGGVSPLLKLLAESPETLRGAWVIDRVIGRAAAAICTLGGAARVYGLVVSDDGAAFLEAHGIPVAAAERVGAILNRDKSGPCPLEASCAGLVDPAEMVAAIREKVASFASK